MPKTVSVAQARANLPQLVKSAAKGKRIVISRYNKPVAALVPVSAAEPKPKLRKLGTGKGRVRIAAPTSRVTGSAEQVDNRRPRFGTGKGRVRILDPHAFDPMTDEEVDAFLEGRY